jgi:hypothetical protein
LRKQFEGKCNFQTTEETDCGVNFGTIAERTSFIDGIDRILVYHLYDLEKKTECCFARDLTLRVIPLLD